MTPLDASPVRSRGAWRGRLAAVGLSIALHGAAAAAFLIVAEDDLPAPGGAISVELVAELPGGNAGAAPAADSPGAKPDHKATEQAAEAPPTEEPKPEPVETARPEPAREPVEKAMPVTPAAEAPAGTVSKSKPPAEPEAARTLEEAARPKLPPKMPVKSAPKPEPERKAAPDKARDSGTAGPAGAAADAPEVAAIERTAPGFAVGSGANPLPDYPYRARRRGQQGRVVLTVSVSPNGVPVEVAVAHSSGHDSLDDAAVDTVRRWRFTPARVGGVAVAGTVEVPITFRLVGEDGR